MDFKAVVVFHHVCTAVSYLCACGLAAGNELKLDK